MRLGQLARKLAIRQTEIVQFLASNNIQIEDGSNTRLEDDHVELVLKRYAPTLELTQEQIVPAFQQAEEREQLSREDRGMQSDEVLENVPFSEPEPANVHDVSENSETEIPEVIKAPKVELPGLKVIGKIELPEPKKKEVPASEGDVPVEKTEVPSEPLPRQERRSLKPNRTARTEPRPRKNPIALQREREAMEAERKKKEQAEREKEKRTQHYHRKIKTTAPTKSVKLVKEEVEEMYTPAVENPTSLWGKFMKWLRRS